MAGGKLRRDDGVLSFARLRSVAEPQDDAPKSLEQLSKALSGFAKPVRLHIRLVSGMEGEIIDDWLVQAGARNAKAKQGRPKDADVTVIMRPETWAAIAQGRLAPYAGLVRRQAPRRR